MVNAGARALTSGEREDITCIVFSPHASSAESLYKRRIEALQINDRLIRANVLLNKATCHPPRLCFASRLDRLMNDLLYSLTFATHDLLPSKDKLPKTYYIIETVHRP